MAQAVATINPGLIVPNATTHQTATAPNPTTTLQQIHDLALKRIATLEYLRKVHQGHVYWYNTILFTRTDLVKMSQFDPRKIGRRATNHFILGLSLPVVLELNVSNVHDYLRTLNAMLTEFETYQQVHASDGTGPSSISRARIPHMFKRSAHTGAKPRRTSGTGDIGPPLGAPELNDSKTSASSGMGATTLTSASLNTGDQDLLPGEEYTYLLTPCLPFEPDFFETYASLCDLLIDCYTRIMDMIHSPASITSGVTEGFAKADAKIRKILIAGSIKEFEESSRVGAKSEFSQLNKLVLTGLL